MGEGLSPRIPGSRQECASYSSATPGQCLWAPLNLTIATATGPGPRRKPLSPCTKAGTSIHLVIFICTYLCIFSEPWLKNCGFPHISPLHERSHHFLCSWVLHVRQIKAQCIETYLFIHMDILKNRKAAPHYHRKGRGALRSFVLLLAFRPCSNRLWRYANKCQVCVPSLVL